MGRWVVVLTVAMVACKGGKKTDGQTGAPEVKAAGLVAPKVSVATVLAKDSKDPPYVLLVDDKNEVRLGAAKTWADFDANKIRISKKPAPFQAIDAMNKMALENFGMGRMGEEAVDSIESFDDYRAGDHLDVAALENTANMGGAQDDPPPPEEDDVPEDDEDDDWGGTGTAITLDEGKMGKKDSDRAEGQYNRQKVQENQQLARQQADEQARNKAAESARINAFAGFATKYRAARDGGPTRVAQIAGFITPDSTLQRPTLMVLVSPTMKVPKLLEILGLTGAAIAVSHENKIRPLRLDLSAFDSARRNHGWLEARVATKGITIEAVPEKAIEITDVNGIAAALDQARKIRGTEAAAPVDVLVDADVDTQRLVDVLVALDVAGVRSIGIGRALPPEEVTRRGHRIPTTLLGTPVAQGDLSKALITDVIKNNLDKITACYANEVANNPALAGTMASQFFITPTGTVAAASATGVDPAVATCVAAVIKALQFPKPQGGGGVQVNYPFTFRP